MRFQFPFAVHFYRIYCDETIIVNFTLLTGFRRAEKALQQPCKWIRVAALSEDETSRRTGEW